MKRTIIVAPLHWGLGHATRCIPIINLLLKSEYTPIIASDGAALELLLKEFPDLTHISLPTYNIHYSKNIIWSLFLQIPTILKAVREEERIIRAYINKNPVSGIISDGRFGVRSSRVPSVYITHQINVFSGVFTAITSRVHRHLIKKFDECWIPDVETIPTLSGKLSQTKKTTIRSKRIGILSRFEKEVKPIDIDILIVLSGPEPHRTGLELKLIQEFEAKPQSVILVQGILSEKQTTSRKGTITVYNFMLSRQLQEAMNSAAIVICRSGYSSILDVAKLNKKVFFIPTPGQTEQEYLAVYLKEKKMAPFAKQKDFKAEMAMNIEGYHGFQKYYKALSPALFDLFEGK